MHDLAEVLAGVFAQILTFVVAIIGFSPNLQLYTALIKAGQLLGLLGFTVLKRLYVSTAALSLLFVMSLRFRLGRGVVVKLVISLTLKGEINNITLNNTLWFHYTTVYRLATVDSEISVTSNTKQQ